MKQDLIDLENVQQITSIETLIQLLRKSVGSPVAYSSLARDLQCSDKTVKRWLTILENMYVIFRVTPLHRNVARSILKAPKFYFYDTGQVLGDAGVRLENLVACALRKEIHYRGDCYGEDRQLFYLRNKEGREIDFCITDGHEPKLLIEVKWSNVNLNPNFKVFSKFLPGIKMIQLVREIKREKTYPNGVEVRNATGWLSTLSLNWQ